MINILLAIFGVIASSAGIVRLLCGEWGPWWLYFVEFILMWYIFVEVPFWLIKRDAKYARTRFDNKHSTEFKS